MSRSVDSLRLRELTNSGQVKTLLGNVNRAIDGTYHASAVRYLAGFAYCFNRRYQLASFVARLAYVSVRTLAQAQYFLAAAGTTR